MKIKKVKDIEQQEVGFNSKSLEVSKSEKPSIKTSLEDQQKLDKEFKKQLTKIHKFESFINIHIDNIENIEWETESDEEEHDEISGCGCCDDCTGNSDCQCGCNDCVCCEIEDDAEKKNFSHLAISPFLKM